MKDRPLRMATATVICLLAAVSTSAAGPPGRDHHCDFFCYMMEANEASLIMLAEEGLLPDPLARQIASAMDRIASE